MRLFHRTDHADEILKNGFRNGKGTYMTPEIHEGVFLSDRPLDENEGASGHIVLTIEIPESILKPYEWIEEGKPYREFLMPAAIANENGHPVIHEVDSMTEQSEERCTKRSEDAVDWLRAFVLRVLDGTTEGLVLKHLMECQPGEIVGTLASVTGRSPTSIKRAANELVRRGLARRVENLSGANGGKYSGYKFAPVKFPELKSPNDRGRTRSDPR